MIVRAFQLLTSGLLRPFIILICKIYYHSCDKLKPLPPVKSPFLLLPANKLAKKIRAKEITCTELVGIYIERIRQVQPFINSVVVECFEEALQEAKNYDRILSADRTPDEYSEENKPLLGVPFTCKESIFVKGKPNTAGLVNRKNSQANVDAAPVRNMRNAGAILLCTTNVSELLMWIESRNSLYGITRNPYNLSRIVGGSSGGEGALLASAGSVMGIGSDIGGSIRIPAFFNGVYGLKPTPGLVNTRNQFPVAQGVYKEKLISTGPMCRYASDLALLLRVQADEEHYTEVAKKFESKVDLKKLKFYVLTDLGSCQQVNQLSEPCRNALNKAVNFIESNLNVKVKKLKLDGFKQSFRMWSSLMSNGEIYATAYTDTIKANLKPNETFNPYLELLKCIFGKSKYTFTVMVYAIFERIPKGKPKVYIRMKDELKKQLQDILGENSVIIAPSFPTVAPYHNQPVFTNMTDFTYFAIWNALGFPVTQTPMGLCPQSGLPVGIQIVANEKCDHLTIRLAEHFEECNVGGWTPGF